MRIAESTLNGLYNLVPAGFRLSENNVPTNARSCIMLEQRKIERRYTCHVKGSEK